MGHKNERTGEEDLKREIGGGRTGRRTEEGKAEGVKQKEWSGGRRGKITEGPDWLRGSE